MMELHWNSPEISQTGETAGSERCRVGRELPDADAEPPGKGFRVQSDTLTQRTRMSAQVLQQFQFRKTQILWHRDSLP